MKKCGFTLIELLTVIAILVILFTLGSKGIRSARLAAKKAQAQVEMKSIETAVKSYAAHYGKLPVDAAQQGVAEPVVNAAFSAGIIRTLTAEDAKNNPAEMIFLDPQSGASSAGTFLDPWGKPYLIYLDTDYNDEVTINYTPLNETVRRKVAVLSVGLFLLDQNSDESRFIKSW